ncbi:hypothetical protein MTO96_046136 [Rhipicephalus appendiculatus]
MSGLQCEVSASHVYTSRNRLVEVRGEKRTRMLRLCATDPDEVAVYCVVSADDAVDFTATEETHDNCSGLLILLHGCLMVPGLIIFMLAIISAVSFKIGKWGPPAEGDTLIAHLEETMSLVITIVCGLVFYGAYTFLLDVYQSVFMSPMLIPH